MYVVHNMDPKSRKKEQKSSLILGNSFLGRWKDMEALTLCNLSFSQSGGRAAKANAGVGNELHSLEQATLFFELSSTKYSNPGHLDNNLLKERMIWFIMKQELGVIWGNLWDLNDVLLLRLEEELNSPHVVSLVTDYNVMPVGKKCIFWTHQRLLNSLS